MSHLPSSATNGWSYTETFSTQSGRLCPAPKSWQVSSPRADAPVEGQGLVLFLGAFCTFRAKTPLTWVTRELSVLQTWPLAWISITHAFSKNREKEIEEQLWKKLMTRFGNVGLSELPAPYSLPRHYFPTFATQGTMSQGSSFLHCTALSSEQYTCVRQSPWQEKTTLLVCHLGYP